MACMREIAIRRAAGARVPLTRLEQPDAAVEPAEGAAQQPQLVSIHVRVLCVEPAVRDGHDRQQPVDVGASAHDGAQQPKESAQPPTCTATSHSEAAHAATVRRSRVHSRAVEESARVRGGTV